MPADTKATKYIWYFDVADKDRKARCVWVPDGGRIESSMTFGTFSVELLVDGEWVEKAACPFPFTVAESYARREGFTVEVPQYEVRPESDPALPLPASMMQEQRYDA